jgi:hypothetical protein
MTHRKPEKTIGLRASAWNASIPPARSTWVTQTGVYVASHAGIPRLSVLFNKACSTVEQ